MRAPAVAGVRPDRGPGRTSVPLSSLMPADPEPPDRSRRFGGLARLYGAGALDLLARTHVCVVGIGGVGSWAAEALVRSGIGRITLVDADHVAESNINRQVHALESTLGAAKVDVMRARLLDIAPDCRVEAVDDFIDTDNVTMLVPDDALVIDAIDVVRAKAALVAHACNAGQAIVVCGAAGGRRDPLQLRYTDLAHTIGDALLASLRARLRREHGFARNGAFGVPALHSVEAPASRTPVAAPASDGLTGGAPLACAGYGSSVSVTATMGFAAASVVLSKALQPA